MGKENLVRLVREHALEFGEFTLKSGQTSHYYLDLRKLTLMAGGLYALVMATAELLKDLRPDVDAIGGPCVGADPLVGGLLFATGSQIGRFGAPVDNVRGFLVRKAEKGHGKKDRIIGSVRPDDRCLLVEDVVTTGGSLLEACLLLREFGAKVEHAFAVIDRGEPGAAQAEFGRHGINFFRLLTIKDLGL